MERRHVIAGAAAASTALALAYALQRSRSCAFALQSGAARAEDMSLAETSERIVELLKRREPQVMEGLPPELHWLPPHIPKVSDKGVCWETLGALVRKAENNIPSSGMVDGSRWISLRLDGTGFSKVVKHLRRNGVLEPSGFSQHFADIMRHCCQRLMEDFHAVVGYTQSDEMTVVIPPASVVRGEQQVHLRGGRVVKLCTVAAGMVTAMFNAKIARLCLDKDLRPDDYLLSHFDCRLGHYSTWEEARSVLLWRAYDCSVNGVSDAVFHASHLQGRKAVVAQYTSSKLKWLSENNMLPLPAHQARGGYFVKVRRRIEGYNPVKKEAVYTLRSRVELVDVPVLELARKDEMLPQDDEMPQTSG
eukprot:TRINITY_DN123864_c0_g1_i1.p1 TRINITY_DN123864_c0_g1~~TRINITY_DN123864_c0_g1_i1.p1  ORF type:complete len:362 (-),score=65.12 TRINITY_DN123864_c0_g1_i1:273-1358(-)